jgi:hypothetical protein
MTRMAHDLIHPPKGSPGERIAVLSPSFAAAGPFPRCTNRRCAGSLDAGLARRDPKPFLGTGDNTNLHH